MLLSYEPQPGERLLSPEPSKHCAICNQATPMVVGRDHMRCGWAMLPDDSGWMIIHFPWPGIAKLREGTDIFREAQLICPPCGQEVAKFIAHRREPMRIEEENL